MAIISGAVRGTIPVWLSSVVNVSLLPSSQRLMMLNVITVFRNDVFAGCRCADEMHRSTALYVHQEAAVCHWSVMYLLPIYWHSHHYSVSVTQITIRDISDWPYVFSHVFRVIWLAELTSEDHMAQMILSFLLPDFSLLLLP